MTTTALHVSGLRRTYGSGPDAYEAVRGVDLEVETGTVTALLGVNGAGKTSTLEVLEGLSRATEGTVRVLGLDPVADRADVRRRTGVLLQTSGFSGDLTVAETLQMARGLVTEPRPLEEALDMVTLTGRADVRVRALSGGETRRLDLACALVGHPELLMLDEPTTGLDPESRRDVWTLLRGLRDTGTTILLTTHYLEEAEELADRLEIMADGQIVASGTGSELAAQYPSTISFGTGAEAPDLPDLPALRGRPERAGTATTLQTDDLQATLTALLGWAADHGVRLEDLHARTASLESVFLSIADRAAHGAPDQPADRTLEGATR